MSSKLISVLQDVLAQAPLLLGQVTEVSGSDLRIQTPDGAIYRARGTASIGDEVYFRPGGSIEGAGPGGTYFDIEV